jgi:FtsH-binding integral membrane protein
MVEIYGYSIATIPIVTTAVYGIIELLKYLFLNNNKKIKKFIPVFSAVIGGIITVVTFLLSPESVPCTAWHGALLMGCASGLSAVGVNQIKKQIQKQGGEDNGS